MANKKDAAVLGVAERQRWREADARLIVEAWRRSGESLSDFAGRYGLRSERIARWVSQMAKRHRGAMRFHRVQLVDVPRGGMSDAIEVVLVDGRRVRVPEGFATVELERVLGVLEGRG